MFVNTLEVRKIVYTFDTTRNLTRASATKDLQEFEELFMTFLMSDVLDNQNKLQSGLNNHKNSSNIKSKKQSLTLR